MNVDALKELLFKMADDQLILGHRSSEWIGLGPLLEEDIAFASKAQDKVGQSLALYELLQSLGEKDPDTVAFGRPATNFHNATFVELPNREFDFSMVRHFLFDNAESIRFMLLAESKYAPLQNLANKFKGEVQYHILHANEWMQQLGNSTPDVLTRMQSVLDEAWPYALGIFEPSPFENELIADGIFAGEKELQVRWLEKVDGVLATTNLKIPTNHAEGAKYGGRIGNHTEHLQPLLTEMGEVIQSDPNTEW